MTLSIDKIVTEVQSDFAAHGITAEVLFGEHKLAYNNGANRVVFGLGDFSFDAPGPQNAPGLADYGEEDDDPAYAARSLFTRTQNVTVTVHAAPPGAPSDSDRSIKAQGATAALLHQTLRALYTVAQGSVALGNGQWLEPKRQEFLYGAVATFVARFDIPVLDDPAQRVTAEVGSVDVYAVFPSGEELAVQAETEE